jgi:hypothetical protein
VIDIRDLTNLLPSDDYPARLAVDTNALLDNPDLPRTQGCLDRSISSTCYPSFSGRSTTGL